MASKIVPYVSATQIGQFLFCPISYYFCYVKGIKHESKNIYMTHGTAVHEALAFNYKQKIKSRKDLPFKDVFQYFNEVFMKGIIDDGLTNSDDMMHVKNFTLITEEKLREYMEEIAPKIMPLEVEYKVEVQLKNYPVKLLVIMDLITENGWIRDHKIVGNSGVRKWTQKSVDKNMQLTLYAAVYRKIFNKAETGVAIDLIPRSLDFKFKTVRSTRSQDDIHQVLSLASSIQKITDLGVFIPNLDNCNSCPFTGVCPKLPLQV